MLNSKDSSIPKKNIGNEKKGDDGKLPLISKNWLLNEEIKNSINPTSSAVAFFRSCEINNMQTAISQTPTPAHLACPELHRYGKQPYRSG